MIDARNEVTVDAFSEGLKAFTEGTSALRTDTGGELEERFFIFLNIGDDTYSAWRMSVCTMSTSQFHNRQHSTTSKGWRSAPDAILLGHRRTRQCSPARTPTVHCGPKGRGWPTPTPKGRSAHAMTRTQDSPTHKSSDKHIPNRRVSTC